MSLDTIDIVAIGKAYVSNEQVAAEILQVIEKYKGKVRSDLLVTVAGKVFVALATMNHWFVEDTFANQVNTQADFIRYHNKVCPDCDAFRRLS